MENIWATDARRMEVIATGLPLFNGAQLAIDTTLVCPVRANGSAQPQTDRTDGAWLQEARRRKETAYPELVHSRRCKLVVLAIEVGGRWSAEAQRFVRMLAEAKSRSSPPLLRKAAAHAYYRRWTAMMSICAQRAFAKSLLELPMDSLHNADGDPPPLE
eukprot:3208453-Karenia_brevis.AAC.1